MQRRQVYVKTGHFTRSERIGDSAAIQTLYRKGRQVRVDGAKLFSLQNGQEINRICFTLKRKYGNAVQRNKAKRLGREVYRLTRAELKRGYDLLLLVYPGNDTFHVRHEQFRLLCEKAGLLNA
jgi:ribonuclease P protein component